MPSSSPEIFRTGYQTLFEVHILHRYFLNVGLTEFDQAPNDAAVQAVRQAYNVSQFLRIEPSPATRELLRNQRLLFRPTPEGFCVLAATAPDPATEAPVMAIALPPAANFTFLAYAADPTFSLYTDAPAGYFASMLPSAANPGGQVDRFYNEGGGIQQGHEILKALAQPWPVGSLRPFAVVDIAHRDNSAQALVESDAPSGIMFQYVLPNRHTRWEYQGPQVAYQGHQLGEFPLVLHGRIAPASSLPFAVANPTAATTIARPDGHYYSLIY